MTPKIEEAIIYSELIAKKVVEENIPVEHLLVLVDEFSKHVGVVTDEINDDV